MKKFLHSKVRVGLLSLFSLYTITTSAQCLLTENFSYNDGNLVGQGNWTQQGAATSFPIQVIDTLLTYEGYQESGDAGKSVKIENSGQDAFKEFTPVSSGDLYVAALVNFSKAQSINTKNGEYFLHLGEGAESIYNFGRIFVKQSAQGDKMIFGISRATTGVSATWGETEYEFNKTHLVVMKYTIVSGDKNDIVSLHINPDITAEPTPLATFNTTGTGNIDPVEIKSVNIRQGVGTLTPIGYVGAIRVATNWADLFNDSPAIETPKLTISSKNVAFGNVYPQEAVTKTINIKGEHLTGNVTISGLNTGELTTSTSIITKEEAESSNGFDLVLTLTPKDVNNYTETILFDSPDIDQIKLGVYWTTATSTENISETRNLFETNQITSEIFKIKNEVLVSHVYTGDSKPIIYVQDAEGALAIQDISDTIKTVYKEGDKIIISGTMDKVWGTTFFYPSRDFGAPISENNTVTPLTVTLADLIAEPFKYEARLIKVENVSFYNKDNENGGIFKQGTNNKIKQNEAEAAISVFKNVDYIDKEIPATATIVGIFRSPSAKLIAPRYEADITNTSTGIKENEIKDINVWNNNTLINIEGKDITSVEIYDMLGHKVVESTITENSFSQELNTGIYIVKVISEGKNYVKKVVLK